MQNEKAYEIMTTIFLLYPIIVMRQRRWTELQISNKILNLCADKKNNIIFHRETFYVINFLKNTPKIWVGQNKCPSIWWTLMQINKILCQLDLR